MRKGNCLQVTVTGYPNVHYGSNGRRELSRYATDRDSVGLPKHDTQYGEGDTGNYFLMRLMCCA